MFRKNYYYLVAGLPDITLDDNKLSFGLAGFMELASQQLSQHDLKLLQSYFWRYDNQNLLNRLEGNDQPHNSLGNISEEEINDILQLAKDDSVADSYPELPSYFTDIINAYKSDDQQKTGKEWENTITAAYYNMVQQVNNEFIANWYQLEKDISNLTAAYQAKKYGWNVENELIGANEITQALIKSNARDFGLTGDFPQLDELLKALEENNILAREKRIDSIKWTLLNEYTFFNYFGIEKVFAFMQKLVWVERWMALDPEKGRNMFKELISELEESYELPNEY
jgi:hypothetical protein